MRRLTNLLFVAVLFLVVNPLVGVAADNDSARKAMQRGEMLLRNRAYPQALGEFTAALESDCNWTPAQKERLEFAIALCDAKDNTGSDGHARLEGFINRHPNSIYVAPAHMILGGLFFDEGNYLHAMQHYLSVDPQNLPSDTRDEYNFKCGYALFKTDDYSQAFPYFADVSSGSTYEPHATYCMGYCCYVEGRYAEARRYFASVADVTEYSQLIPYYLYQMEFLEGNFDYTARNGRTLATQSTPQRSIELVRIMGESWFRLQEWQKASECMNQYKAAVFDLDRYENYILGYSQYMSGDYRNAVSSLAKVCGTVDSLTQSASYHLADCYLHLADKASAAKSFSMASVAGFDDTLAEDALFNYCKLQFESDADYFNESINIMNRFLSTYPASQNAPQIRQYLITAYYNAHNYDAAYQAIVSFPDPDNDIKSALQKITYYRATELIREGNLTEAQKCLDLSLQNAFNSKYTALAGYWQGELLLSGGEYGRAEEYFKRYLKVAPKDEAESKTALYALGYSYFNRKNYVTAAEYFNLFLQAYPTIDAFRADAFNRLGDIDYSNRDYWQAQENYARASSIGGSEGRYADFQNAMMLGYSNRTDRKIEALNGIINLGEGDYVSQALYELGRTYILSGDYTKAASIFKQYVSLYPSSDRYLAALSSLGLIYQNLNKNSDALSYYKRVVEAAPASIAAKDAMAAIRSIYIDNNDIDSYLAYAKSVGFQTDMSVARRDSIAYVAAEKLYLAGNKSAALESFKEYLSVYAQGAYRPSSLYYAADCASSTGATADAEALLTNLAAMYDNEYTTACLLQLAPMREQHGDHAAASEYYHRLMLATTDSQQQREVTAGYLRNTVAVADTGKIIEAANEVLQRTSDDDMVRMARFAKAKALDTSDKHDEAIAVFTQLARETQNAEGAESAYILAESAFAAGELRQAEQMVFRMADNKSTPNYWLGRAFLVLGDVYAARDDSFQARATYQSIVDGYLPLDDGVVESAKEKIKNLK